VRSTKRRSTLIVPEFAAEPALIIDEIELPTLD
jgi:hypothetical protein